MKRNTCKPTGFTLVELLVVIGVIALLISILLPTLSAAREAANQVACQSNLRTVGQGLVLYAGESRGSLPYGFWPGGADGVTNDYARQYDWPLKIQSMLGDTADNRQAADGQDYLDQRLRDIFRCPTADRDLPQPHLMSHPRLMPRSNTPDRYTPTPTDYLKPYRLSRIPRSSEIALIFDASQAAPNPTATPGPSVAERLDDWYIYFDGRAFVKVDWTTDDADPINVGMNRDGVGHDQNIRYRHRGDTATNVLFADGHVADDRIGAFNGTHFWSGALTGQNFRLEFPN